MKQIILTIIAIFLSIASFAQNGKITGKIKDIESGNSLMGATVRVKGKNIGTTSGPDGSFILTNIPSGKQTIITSYVGFGSMSKDVNIVEGETTNVDFSLEVSTILGDEIVVSATRRPEKLTQAPASISIITAKDLDQLASFNVGELASKIQGVEFVRTGVNGVGINARGFNNAFNAKILAMTDGRNSMMAGGSGLAAGIMNTIIK